jgi:hypothetical protein
VWVVVDTNVLMSHLSLVERAFDNLMGAALEARWACGRVCLYACVWRGMDCIARETGMDCLAREPLAGNEWGSSWSKKGPSG